MLNRFRNSRIFGSGVGVAASVKSLRLNLLMFGSAFVLLGNNLTFNSPLIGALGSLTFFVVGGYLLKGVFKTKNSAVNLILGVALILELVGLVSWVFTVSYKLGSREVFVSLCLVTFFVSLVHRFTHNQHAEAEKSEDHVKWFVRVLEGIFIVLTVLQFLLLLNSRTGVPMTVWTTLNPLVMPIFFFNVMVLIIILFSGEKWQVTLLLILVQSILAHMFFVLVFDAGYGKDQWEALGWSRRVFDGSNYPEAVPFNLNSYLPGKGLNYKILKALGSAFYPTLSTVLSRTFSIDIFWGHISLIPSYGECFFL